MCRQSVDLPDLSDHSEDDHSLAQIEGFMQVYRVSEWRAREACEIHRISMRQLLTTHQRMPVVWMPVNMVFNLPRVLVAIARRFHYKSIGQPVPSDLSLLKLQLDKAEFDGFWKSEQLQRLARADAPLARHPDAYDLHEFLCYRIAHYRSLGSGDQNALLDSKDAS